MSQAALSPDQFSFIKATPKEMGGSHEHRIGVGPNRSHGELRWHHKTGEILGINVHPQFRRQGIATAMLGEARNIASTTRGVTPPRHSPQRTNEGEAWARSLGERLPRRVAQ